MEHITIGRKYNEGKIAYVKCEKNCSLENIKGTDKTDKYYVNNSVVNNIFDLSGDEGNRDRVYLNKSYVSEYKCDKDDKFSNFNINEKISF